jgi:hypothetical protein
MHMLSGDDGEDAVEACGPGERMGGRGDREKETQRETETQRGERGDETHHREERDNERERERERERKRERRRESKGERERDEETGRAQKRQRYGQKLPQALAPFRTKQPHPRAGDSAGEAPVSLPVPLLLCEQSHSAAPHTRESTTERARQREREIFTDNSECQPADCSLVRQKHAHTWCPPCHP